VTIGGKPPFHVTATGVNSSIQKAIDNASPGDLIMIDPLTRATSALAAVPAVSLGNVVMWKPVRLQGVGARQRDRRHPNPAGKLDAWRRQVNCLVGLAINGQPPNAGNPSIRTTFLQLPERRLRPR